MNLGSYPNNFLLLLQANLSTLKPTSIKAYSLPTSLKASFCHLGLKFFLSYLNQEITSLKSPRFTDGS